MMRDALGTVQCIINTRTHSYDVRGAASRRGLPSNGHRHHNHSYKYAHVTFDTVICSTPRTRAGVSANLHELIAIAGPGIKPPSAPLSFSVPPPPAVATNALCCRFHPARRSRAKAVC